jgi:hypothetical protein
VPVTGDGRRESVLPRPRSNDEDSFADAHFRVGVRGARITLTRRPLDLLGKRRRAGVFSRCG